METADLRASKNIRYRAESAGKHYKSPQKIWFKRLGARYREFESPPTPPLQVNAFREAADFCLPQRNLCVDFCPIRRRLQLLCSEKPSHICPVWHRLSALIFCHPESRRSYPAERPRNAPRDLCATGRGRELRIVKRGGCAPRRQMGVRAAPDSPPQGTPPARCLCADTADGGGGPFLSASRRSTTGRDRPVPRRSYPGRRRADNPASR